MTLGRHPIHIQVFIDDYISAVCTERTLLLNMLIEPEHATFDLFL